MISDDIRKELEKALNVDQEKALDRVEAMDKLDEEIWGEPPEEE